VEADIVREVGIAIALAACSAPAVPAPQMPPPSWSRDGLHVTGAPPVDREIMKWLEAYDDAVGYRVLDFDPSQGMLVEHGGELEQIARADATPVALSPYELDVERAVFRGGGEVWFTADTDGDEHMRLWTARFTANSAKLVSESADAFPARPAPRVDPAVTGAAGAREVAVSPDGHRVAYITDEDGVSALHLWDSTSRTDHVAPASPKAGVISHLRFAPGAPLLAFSFAEARHPADAYTYDVETDQLQPWTHAELHVPAVEPTHEAIAAFDGTKLHALVYRPSQPHGVVIELHGGPEDRFTPVYSPLAQALVARGYVVIQPNVRGSSGYGAAFAALDDGRRREDAVRDVGSVLEWARRIDAQPAVVIGTSYGGYLALAALAAYPDRLRAGVVISGIPDLVDFLAHTAAYRADERRAEYGDERDPPTREFLAHISPRAAAIRAPLLVAHGQRDPRVAIGAVDRFVAAVRAGGGTVWYARADDEGHLFTKTTNRMVLQALVMQLLSSVR
jgi:dipeptidyl aminopeptidase/acylaminoacyl peptidase